MEAVEYSNNLIQEERMPAIQSMATQALSEKYAPTNRLVNLIGTLLLVLIISILNFQSFVSLPSNILSIFPYVIWAIGVLGLIQVVYSSYADLRKTYALRELDLNYSSGLIFQQYQRANRVFQRYEWRRQH